MAPVAVASASHQLPSASVQADFYAKLARLQDDVAAKSHTRIRLPTPALERLKNGSAKADAGAFAQSAPVSNGLAAAVAAAAPVAHSSTTLKPAPGVAPASVTDALEPQAAHTALAAQLLDKRRRQIEAQIRQDTHAERKRAAAERVLRKNDNMSEFHEHPHVFDTTQVLAAALRLVKPVSGYTAPKEDSASSFDENDYYSSQVNSPDQSRSEGEITSPPKSHPLASQSQTAVKAVSQRNAQAYKAQPPGTVSHFSPVRTTKPFVSFTKSRNMEHWNQRRGALKTIALGKANAKVNIQTEPREGYAADDSNSREESYSPPAPDAFRLPQAPALPPASQYQHQSGLHVPVASNFPVPKPFTFNNTERSRESDESYSPPAPSAPLSGPSLNGGPQVKPPGATAATPAALVKVADVVQRVNTFAKQRRKAIKDAKRAEKERQKEEQKAAKKQAQKHDKQQKQSRDEQVAQAAQAAHAALAQSQGSAAAPPLDNPRKRRRDTDPNFANGQQAQPTGKRTRAISPLPYIKPEPQSPPPFTNVAPSNEPPRELKFRDDGRAELVEVESPLHSGHPGSNHQALSQQALGHRIPENQAANQQALTQVPRRQVQYISDDDVISPRYVERPQQQYIHDQPVRASAVQRRSVYDSGDLRRVASYQNASMRPVSPEMVPMPRPQRVPEDVRYMRAPSRIVSERPMSTYQQQFYEDPEVQQVSYFRPVQRREPAYYDLEEPAMMPARQMMMPPPTTMAPPAMPRQRIYRDEFGEEWIAVPAPRGMRASMAPEAVYESRQPVRYAMEPQQHVYEPRAASRAVSMAPPAGHPRGSLPAEYDEVYRVAAPSRTYSVRPDGNVAYTDDVEYQPRYRRRLQ